MMVKQQAIDLIKSLPEDCTLEDIQYHLYVCEKIEKGICAIEEGRLIPHEEVEQKWKLFGKMSLARAYGTDEPEYTKRDLK